MTDRPHRPVTWEIDPAVLITVIVLLVICAALLVYVIRAPADPDWERLIKPDPEHDAREKARAAELAELDARMRERKL